jgi:Zn-dependent protease with chaperone function
MRKQVYEYGGLALLAALLLPATVQINSYLAERGYERLLALLLVWLAGLLLLFGLGKFFSQLALYSLATADPNGAPRWQEHALRLCYRRLIELAGLYYYLSLPIVLYLMLLLTGALLYLLLWLGLGNLPVNPAAFLLVGVTLTLYKLLRTLFIKVERQDPGRPLETDEAPQLFALTREVAQAVGTRPLDEIRITPDTELAVYERGSLAEKRQDRAERILIIGAGMLHGLRLNAFRAILAHEYGHFCNRDTAGGAVALRVNRDLLNFAYALALTGQATWSNLVFQFIRLYYFLFRRLSHGALRWQEVLADRVAVRNYGAAAFEEGLCHAICRDVEFNYLTARELQAATFGARGLRNVYALQGTPDHDCRAEIEATVAQAILRPTDDDDSHPSPVERFHLARHLNCNNTLPPDGAVWELFADKDGLLAEMNEKVCQEIRQTAEAAWAEAI